MNIEQKMVFDFHTKMDQFISKTPAIPEISVQKIRYSLISEELEELQLAFATKNLVEVADAIGDLLYVVYGTAVSCGIDIEPIFKEIHRSNMTKKPTYNKHEFKLIKSDSFSKPNLKPILEDQKKGEI